MRLIRFMHAMLSGAATIALFPATHVERQRSAVPSQSVASGFQRDREKLAKDFQHAFQVIETEVPSNGAGIETKA
jgi:hypothetical protein